MAFRKIPEIALNINGDIETDRLLIRKLFGNLFCCTLRNSLLKKSTNETIPTSSASEDVNAENYTAGNSDMCSAHSKLQQLNYIYLKSKLTSTTSAATNKQQIRVVHILAGGALLTHNKQKNGAQESAERAVCPRVLPRHHRGHPFRD